MVLYSYLFKNLPQFVVMHTAKGFSVVKEADVFLECSCFLYDLTDVGNLISGFSAFSKPNLFVHLEVFSSHTAEASLEEF